MRVIDDADPAARDLAVEIQKARRCVALTGAGASAASGVPTYRGAGGSWTRYDPQRYASVDGFRSDPSYYWGFFRDERYPTLSRARPNPVHRALATLEGDGWLEALVTQNIDGLHQAAGSHNVLEVHGSSRRFVCKGCGGETDHEAAWRQLQESLPPRCPGCGEERLRPDVVMFGEALPADVIEKAAEHFAAAPLALVVGSSLVVHPAASLPMLTLRSGGRLVILNIDPTPFDELAALVVRAPADEVLPRTVALL